MAGLYLSACGGVLVNASSPKEPDYLGLAMSNLVAHGGAIDKTTQCGGRHEHFKQDKAESAAIKGAVVGKGLTYLDHDIENHFDHNVDYAVARGYLGTIDAKHPFDESKVRYFHVGKRVTRRGTDGYGRIVCYSAELPVLTTIVGGKQEYEQILGTGNSGSSKAHDSTTKPGPHVYEEQENDGAFDREFDELMRPFEEKELNLWE